MNNKNACHRIGRLNRFFYSPLSNSRVLTYESHHPDFPRRINGGYTVWCEDKRIAHLSIGRQQNRKKHLVQLCDILVEEEYRGRGFGRQIILDFETFLKAHSISRIQLIDVLDSSRRFWTKMGYTLNDIDDKGWKEI
jgi:GNAT superfamily N-acetyltransferase